MDQARDLSESMLPPGSGASFAAAGHASLARIEPLTVAAENRLREQIAGGSSWDGAAVVVEMRYFANLADAIIAAGCNFEPDALAK